MKKIRKLLIIPAKVHKKTEKIARVLSEEKDEYISQTKVINTVLESVELDDVRKLL